MSNPTTAAHAPGYYDDGSGVQRWWDGTAWGQVKPPTPGPVYTVLQVVLKEQLVGTGSKNLGELESVINRQTSQGWRLHTITTASSGSKGIGGGDRIQATLVFEKL